MSANLPPYITLEKKVGQTPLEVLEYWRKENNLSPDLPLAYAGRLDPMASGKLLILIGDTCKVQEQYHNLDKAYTFAVVFGLKSDSGDVLGITKEGATIAISEAKLQEVLKNLIGEISLPFPIFSSRTVKGKPLHTWAVEGRLAEISIPVKSSKIYQLSLIKIYFLERQNLIEQVKSKIAQLPKVTDPRKALGNDFRRPEVLSSWDTIVAVGTPSDQFMIAELECTASSGTYMRSLAEEIAKRLDTVGLAFSIHRRTIGRFNESGKTWSLQF